MKPAKKVELPVLKDIVVPGKEVPEKGEFPPVLDNFQVKALEQQIEKIVRKKLETVLNRATKETVTEIKKHIDKVLPTLIKEANQAIEKG
ncbi:MAG: hypothetical protein KAI83_10010 [Thiomargarita sp.]|nr:hypothetical protein [Thiomargarita sp.]